MSKLAHSNTETMYQIEFDRAIEDGNEDLLSGFWFVRHQGEVRVAEWRNNGRGWEWDFTRSEVAKKVDHILEFLQAPTELRTVREDWVSRVARNARLALEQKDVPGALKILEEVLGSKDEG